ncbi:hypothetical protein TrCOL_g9456 [Triparma columacea]|uniref:Uncharacterized protein n=1 Tax=Triparma columacea TaxID=722753 RepID=A0A9W7G870_9STRA|nr:hypothetical protein TrCOL_g9456 [Triparma columacea]
MQSISSPQTVVRHNTREHAQLNNTFLSTTSFGSQSPGGVNGSSYSNNFDSFLEGVMTEEERRTRTRHLPDVDGFTALTKSECKSDLKLARSWGPVEPGDVSQDEGMTGYNSQPNEQCPPETAGVFVPPVGVNFIDDDSPSAHTLNVPQLVESLTSFNPPRPPESSGQNKKRRLQRWEKQPNTISDDLESYRRTVTKTREELNLAISERERVEEVASAFRTHFLNQLRSQEAESVALTRETQEVVKLCLKEAEGTKGRGRREITSLKDCMELIKDVGKKIHASNPAFFNSKPQSEQLCGGIGGVPIGNVGGETIMGLKEIPTTLANSWLLPGDKVSTPYGEGHIEAILPTSTIKPASADAGTEKLLPPRVSVNLEYGKAYMAPAEITPLINPLTLTDGSLMSRWNAMLTTSFLTSSIADAEAMSFEVAGAGIGYDAPPGDAALVVKDRAGSQNQAAEVEAGDGGNAPMDVVKEESAVKEEGESNPSRGGPKGQARLIRFGDSMIPTPGGRGASLSGIKSANLGKAMTAAVMDRQIKDRGFLCNDETMAVPDGYREWEEERTEIYRMKGEMLQLKKIIKRQELAKSLTEKALAAAEGFRERQQEEMKEIKTDLDELRGKCSAELRDLGISEEKAKVVLKAKLMDNSPEEPAPEKPKKKSKPASNQFGANRASKRKRGNGRGRGKKSNSSPALNHNPASTVAFSGMDQHQGGQLSLPPPVSEEAVFEEEVRAPARRGPKRGRGEEEEVADDAPKAKKKGGRGRIRTMS